MSKRSSSQLASQISRSLNKSESHLISTHFAEDSIMVPCVGKSCSAAGTVAEAALLGGKSASDGGAVALHSMGSISCRIWSARSMSALRAALKRRRRSRSIMSELLEYPVQAEGPSLSHLGWVKAGSRLQSLSVLLTA